MKGRIPSGIFDKMSNLEYLLMYSNYLTGPTPSITSNLELNTLDISDNAFTGDLSPSYFNLPSLKILVVSLNCLSTDPLPPNLCNASSAISQLYMTSISRNTNKCPHKMNLFDLDVLQLPDCIWSMQSLTKLYISGNLFYGIVLYTCLYSTRDQKKT